MRLITILLLISLISFSYSQQEEEDDPTTKEKIIAISVLSGIVVVILAWSYLSLNKSTSELDEANELKKKGDGENNYERKKKILLESKFKYESFIKKFKEKYKSELSYKNLGEDKRKYIQEASDSIQSIDSTIDLIEFEGKKENLIGYFKDQSRIAKSIQNDGEISDAIQVYQNIIDSISTVSKFQIYVLDSLKENSFSEIENCLFQLENMFPVEFSKYDSLKNELDATRKKLDKLKSELEEFHVYGKIIRRDKKFIQIIGSATPLDGDFRKYGSVPNEGSIVVKGYDQNGIGYDQYHGKHYFLGKTSGKNAFGGVVEANLYGDLESVEIKFEKLRLEKINKELEEIKNELGLEKIRDY